MKKKIAPGSGPWRYFVHPPPVNEKSINSVQHLPFMSHTVQNQKPGISKVRGGPPYYASDSQGHRKKILKGGWGEISGYVGYAVSSACVKAE